MVSEAAAACPCDPGRAWSACCGRYVDGGDAAPTPEALMRSRYSAYARGRALYLRESWHPRTRPRTIELDPTTRWLGLTVVRAVGDTVEFVARYRAGGAAGVLREHSRFERWKDRWVYVDGDVLE